MFRGVFVILVDVFWNHSQDSQFHPLFGSFGLQKRGVPARSNALPTGMDGFIHPPECWLPQATAVTSTIKFITGS